MKGNEKGRLYFSYTFVFDTDAAPDELWLYPAGRKDDTDWHYQINTKTFSISRKPLVEE